MLLIFLFIRAYEGTIPIILPLFIRMSPKLWETASGATVWSNSSWGTWTIGGVSFDSKGRVSAGYSYPIEKQREILTALVRALNGDFWPTYEKHKVKE